MMRIGHGYDVHRLVEGRKCIIGGVDIPHSKGLLGHSDAAYEGADSIMLCKRVAEVMKENGYEIGNVDATVIAQAPKMAPYILQMRENLAAALSTDVLNVSVKATTEEKLGFTGEGLGISAHAVCLLKKA